MAEIRAHNEVTSEAEQPGWRQRKEHSKWQEFQQFKWLNKMFNFQEVNIETW